MTEKASVSLYASRASNYARSTERTLSALIVQHNFKVIAHVRPPTSSAGFIIVEAPFASGEPWSSKWFTLSDNGGEVQVSLINGPCRYGERICYVELGIPFTHFAGIKITAETMAYRIAAAIRGDAIDWDFEAPSLAAWLPLLAEPLPIEPKTMMGAIL